MKSLLSALVSGLLFALGLSVAGMTLPSNIVGFLDVLGEWKPALALVMGGAVAVNLLAYRFVLRRGRPLLEPHFVLPTRKDIDAPLVIGALLFGAGWGLSGYCPGPAITALGAGSTKTLVFVASMLAGMGLFGLYDRYRARSVPKAGFASA